MQGTSPGLLGPVCLSPCFELSGLWDPGEPNFLQGPSLPRCYLPCDPPSVNCGGMAEKWAFPTGMCRGQAFCGTEACRAQLTQSPSTLFPRQMGSVP